MLWEDRSSYAVLREHVLKALALLPDQIVEFPEETDGEAGPIVWGNTRPSLQAVVAGILKRTFAHTQSIANGYLKVGGSLVRWLTP